MPGPRHSSVAPRLPNPAYEVCRCGRATQRDRARARRLTGQLHGTGSGPPKGPPSLPFGFCGLAGVKAPRSPRKTEKQGPGKKKPPARAWGHSGGKILPRADGRRRLLYTSRGWNFRKHTPHKPTSFPPGLRIISPGQQCQRWLARLLSPACQVIALHLQRP